MEYENFESLDTLVLVLDPPGRVVHANRALTELTGLTLEQLRGQLASELLALPEEAQAARNRLALLAAGEPLSPRESHLPTAAGEPRWVAWSWEPVRGPDGALQSVICVGVDRTGSRRAEEARGLSQAKLDAVVTLAGDGIVAMDEAQQIVLFNDGAEAIFGWKRAELLGKPLELLVPERLRGRHHGLIRTFSALAGSGAPATHRAEVLARRRNGEEFPAEIAISASKVGSALLATAIIRDITARKREEKEQRLVAELGEVLAGTLEQDETLERTAALLVRELADSCVIDLPPRGGDPRRLKAAWRRPVRAGMPELVDSLPESARPPFVTKVLETGESLLVRELAAPELAAMVPDQEQLAAVRELAPRSMLAVPLTAHGATLGALILSSTHSTERYGPEDLRLARRLADVAALSLSNARLYDESRRALLAREAVLGIVAHDLRNPLFSIRLAAGLLSSSAGRPAADLHRQVEVILRAEGQMSRLIEDLLEAFTIETGAFTIDPRRHELEPLVREALSLQEPQARAREVRLRNELPGALPAILCDRSRLLQVLANLLGNAVKFAKDGGSAVVQARRLDGELCVEVSDDGPGIAEEDHVHLFDRFWKGRTRGPHGAGLGLYIARGIVEAHRGRIWVTSQPGAGSTFSFTLPLAPDEPAAG